MNATLNSDAEPSLKPLFGPARAIPRRLGAEIILVGGVVAAWVALLAALVVSWNSGGVQ